MTRRLRCYVAAPRSLARSVVQIHTMLEDHGVRPMSLWADGVAALPDNIPSDAMLDPRRARWIFEDNRKAIAASDIVFAYLPGWLEEVSGRLGHDGEPLWPTQPKETYCELEDARTSGKTIVFYGSPGMIPLSLVVYGHECGGVRVFESVTEAVDFIGRSAKACRDFTQLAPCLRDLWGDDNPHQDAEDAAARWRLIPGGT